MPSHPACPGLNSCLPWERDSLTQLLYSVPATAVLSVLRLSTCCDPLPNQVLLILCLNTFLCKSLLFPYSCSCTQPRPSCLCSSRDQVRECSGWGCDLPAPSSGCCACWDASNSVSTGSHFTLVLTFLICKNGTNNSTCLPGSLQELNGSKHITFSAAVAHWTQKTYWLWLG